MLIYIYILYCIVLYFIIYTANATSENETVINSKYKCKRKGKKQVVQIIKGHRYMNAHSEPLKNDYIFTVQNIHSIYTFRKITKV